MQVDFLTITITALNPKVVIKKIIINILPGQYLNERLMNT